MDHVFNAGAVGEVEGFEDRYYSGTRPNGIYIPRFKRLREKGRDFLRGYGYQGDAFRADWRRGITAPGFGAELKHNLRRPGHWNMYLEGYGECLPNYDNEVFLDSRGKDSWGIPILNISCTFGSNEDALRNDFVSEATEMLDAAGLKNISTFQSEHKPGFSIHEMGTARMGRDRKTSFLNGYNQSHEVRNLFVTDGSCMTSSACQNPSLTYMALTARACDYAVGEMKRGNL
jgi:choline dehydrogenase-like flavoprotein